MGATTVAAAVAFFKGYTDTVQPFLHSHWGGGMDLLVVSCARSVEDDGVSTCLLCVCFALCRMAPVSRLGHLCSSQPE